MDACRLDSEWCCVVLCCVGGTSEAQPAADASYVGGDVVNMVGW